MATRMQISLQWRPEGAWRGSIHNQPGEVSTTSWTPARHAIYTECRNILMFY
jgi:hypothetical protein